MDKIKINSFQLTIIHSDNGNNEIFFQSGLEGEEEDYQQNSISIEDAYLLGHALLKLCEGR